MIRVISTGYTTPEKQPLKDACLASVAAQDCRIPFVHTYLEAAQQTPAKGPLENLWYEIQRARPSDILVLLDGDDTLTHPSVLARVCDAYGEGPYGPRPLPPRRVRPWITYGSFQIQGKRDFRKELPADASRLTMQCPSHLKTFRAALGQKLEEYPDLRCPDGTWRDFYRDGAVMFPLLEMAGPEHRRFIPDVLVDYNYAWSEEMRNGTPEFERRSVQAVRDIRALAPKKMLETLEF